MNDDQFEETMCMLVRKGFDSTAEQLHARDKAQRQALARVEQQRDDAQEATLSACTAVNRLTDELDVAQAQLAEAVELLRKVRMCGVLGESGPDVDSEIGQFIARHAQVGQQEAREETLDDILNSPCAPCEEDAKGAASEPVGLNCRFNIPKRKCSKNLPYRGFLIVEGWNSCIDEFLAINPHLNLDPHATAHGSESK